MDDTNLPNSLKARRFLNLYKKMKRQLSEDEAAVTPVLITI